MTAHAPVPLTDVRTTFRTQVTVNAIYAKAEMGDWRSIEWQFQLLDKLGALNGERLANPYVALDVFPRQLVLMCCFEVSSESRRD
jgi:hypothetical protein